MINESLLTNGSSEVAGGSVIVAVGTVVVAVGTVVVAGGTVVVVVFVAVKGKTIQQTKIIAIQVVIQILARPICEQ